MEPVEEFRDKFLTVSAWINIYHEKSNTNTDCLDVEMLKGRDGRITTDIYHKPAYSFNYITFDSGHPRHTKVNIPFNMERRIRTKVSDEERSKQKLEDFKSHYGKQKLSKKTRRRWNQASKKYPKRRTNRTNRRKQQHQYCLCHNL